MKLFALLLALCLFLTGAAAAEDFQLAAPELRLEFDWYSNSILTWDAVENADGYRLYRRDADGAEHYIDVYDEYFMDMYVTTGATYVYAVSAFRGDISSEISAEIAATIPPMPATHESGEYEYHILPDGGVETAAYLGDADIIIIPEEIDGRPVSRVGEYTFFECLARTITIPECVTHIGEGAFGNCENLKNLRVPANVAYIGKHAFGGCPNLVLRVAPANPHYKIIDGALYDNRDNRLIYYPAFGAEYFAVPDGTASIDCAFTSCKFLRGVSLPESVTRLEREAFQNCGSLTEIKLPEGLTHIGEDALSSCLSLITVELPDNLRVIGDNAFAFCDNLSYLHMPENLVYIGYEAFYGCDALTLFVTEGTCAHMYAQENHIPYVIRE